MPRVKVIHGPLLDRLGERETDLYGTEPLDEINASLVAMGQAAGIEVHTYQSNTEGELVTEIANCRGNYQFLILNPAAYSHTSVAILDAVVFCAVPTIEVHLSNLAARHRQALHHADRGRVHHHRPRHRGDRPHRGVGPGKLSAGHALCHRKVGGT